MTKIIEDVEEAVKTKATATKKEEKPKEATYEVIHPVRHGKKLYKAGEKLVLKVEVAKNISFAVKKV